MLGGRPELANCGRPNPSLCIGDVINVMLQIAEAGRCPETPVIILNTFESLGGENGEHCGGVVADVLRAEPLIVCNPVWERPEVYKMRSDEDLFEVSGGHRVARASLVVSCVSGLELNAPRARNTETIGRTGTEAGSAFKDDTVRREHRIAPPGHHLCLHVCAGPDAEEADADRQARSCSHVQGAHRLTNRA